MVSPSRSKVPAWPLGMAVVVAMILASAASGRAALTAKCVALSATVCKTTVPLIPTMNVPLTVTMPGNRGDYFLTLTSGVGPATLTGGQSHGGSKAGYGPVYTATLTTPGSEPAGAKLVLTFELAPGNTQAGTTTGAKSTVKTGRYTGKSAQGEPVSFTVSSARNKITGFTTLLDDGNCGQVGGPAYTIKAPPITVAVNGAFSATVKGAIFGLPTVEIRVSGSLSAAGAHGTLARLAAHCRGPNRAATSAFTAQAP